MHINSICSFLVAAYFAMNWKTEVVTPGNLLLPVHDAAHPRGSIVKIA